MNKRFGLPAVVFLAWLLLPVNSAFAAWSAYASLGATTSVPRSRPASIAAPGQWCVRLGDWAMLYWSIVTAEQPGACGRTWLAH